jgi:hypothetical protein
VFNGRLEVAKNSLPEGACVMLVIDRPPNEWVERIRAEYLEMPGLCLTRRQMRRLFVLDAGTCDAAVDELVRSGFLRFRADQTCVRAE